MYEQCDCFCVVMNYAVGNYGHMVVICMRIIGYLLLFM
jgi:hypothetical protein